ncbi:hypothetical protein PUN28_006252 [Cardiocondyla obscurior]|uniref:Uncharacterized protein n=1 Tax=Cardiocondyla obscurior TaxID=286306 RepID=A0AAW2GCS0_9HYME
MQPVALIKFNIDNVAVDKTKRCRTDTREGHMLFVEIQLVTIGATGGPRVIMTTWSLCTPKSYRLPFRQLRRSSTRLTIVIQNRPASRLISISFTGSFGLSFTGHRLPGDLDLRRKLLKRLGFQWKFPHCAVPRPRRRTPIDRSIYHCNRKHATV